MIDWLIDVVALNLIMFLGLPLTYHYPLSTSFTMQTVSFSVSISVHYLHLLLYRLSYFTAYKHVDSSSLVNTHCLQWMNRSFWSLRSNRYTGSREWFALQGEQMAELHINLPKPFASGEGIMIKSKVVLETRSSSDPLHDALSCLQTSLCATTLAMPHHSAAELHTAQLRDSTISNVYRARLQSSTPPHSQGWNHHPLKRYRQLWAQLQIVDGVLCRQYAPTPKSGAVTGPHPSLLPSSRRPTSQPWCTYG